MFVAPQDVHEGTVVARGPNVGEVDVDGLALLVDEGAGRGHALSPTGSVVWRCLDGTSTMGEIIDDIADVFGSPRPDVAGGVIQLVQNLGALGLLEGVLRDFATIPIDIQFVDEDDCADPGTSVPPAETPSFDSRYLVAPPNP